jgi:hypothetical protein
MAELDAILEKYTDASTGSIHGASLIAVNSRGMFPRYTAALVSQSALSERMVGSFSSVFMNRD